MGVVVFVVRVSGVFWDVFALIVFFCPVVSVLCYHLIWILQTSACHLDPLPSESLQPSTTATFSNLYETTPVLLSIHFAGSLYQPHQLSDKESWWSFTPAAPCCSPRLCGASSLGLGPSCRVLTSTFPPSGDGWTVQGSGPPERSLWRSVSNHLAADRKRSRMSWQIPVDRGQSRESNLGKCSLVISVVSASSSLLRLPAETTEAPLHLRARRPTLTSSLKCQNRIKRDSIKRRDERCVAREGRGRRARLKTPDLAGCYFLWAVVSTGEDVIAHLTRIVSSHRSPATARNGNLREWKKKEVVEPDDWCADVTTLSPPSVWIVQVTHNSSRLTKWDGEKRMSSF